MRWYALLYALVFKCLQPLASAVQSDELKRVRKAARCGDWGEYVTSYARKPLVPSRHTSPLFSPRGQTEQRARFSIRLMCW